VKVERRIFKKWDMGVWTGLSWLRIDRWRALVNAVMNLRVPLNVGNFLTSCKLLKKDSVPWSMYVCNMFSDCGIEPGQL
jgi:hypothetical protein